jgi:hypothetical protein
MSIPPWARSVLMELGRPTVIAAALMLAASITPAVADARGHKDALEPVVEGLDGPRGVDHLGHG